MGELNYSLCMVGGGGWVTASLQEGNLSLHFKCDASLHHCLLSLLFLFNNLITAPDLIFFSPNEFAKVHANEYSSPA